MRTRQLGTKGPQVSVIGQGTWRMHLDDEAGCIAALRRGFELGMTHVDTAELYGEAEQGIWVEERVVAKAIAGVRDDLFLVSKVKPEHADYPGTLWACEQSLKRLQTDRLDCYLLHWQGPHPLEETLRAFEQLERDGKIRSFGVSNFDVPALDRVVSLVGEGRLACNQVLYHLEERGIERRVLPWCEQYGVTVVGYSPFGAGRRFPQPEEGPGKVLAEVAARRGATPRQVALAFLLRRERVLVIPKHASVRHAEDNAGGANVTLDSGDVAALEAAFPVPAGHGLPTL